jgi:hypothetical protein
MIIAVGYYIAKHALTRDKLVGCFLRNFEETRNYNFEVALRA